jgi:hypothetical protein
MEDVEVLHSQLLAVGVPVHAHIANCFIRSLEEKSLGERVRKWKLRKIHLEKLLQNANSQAAAGSQTPAPNLLSASGHGNSEAEAAADSAERAGSQDLGEASSGGFGGGAADSAAPHPNSGAAADSAVPPENTPKVKPGRSASASAYSKLLSKQTGGKAPEMALIHVSFAELSAELLRENTALRMCDLIQKFNAFWPGKAPEFGLPEFHTANNFFLNGYFTMTDLKAMANGDAPFPIPMSAGAAAKPAGSRQSSRGSARDGGTAGNSEAGRSRRPSKPDAGNSEEGRRRRSKPAAAGQAASTADGGEHRRRRGDAGDGGAAAAAGDADGESLGRRSRRSGKPDAGNSEEGRRHSSKPAAADQAASTAGDASDAGDGGEHRRRRGDAGDGGAAAAAGDADGESVGRSLRSNSNRRRTVKRRRTGDSLPSSGSATEAELEEEGQFWAAMKSDAQFGNRLVRGKTKDSQLPPKHPGRIHVATLLASEKAKWRSAANVGQVAATTAAADAAAPGPAAAGPAAAAVAGAATAAADAAAADAAPAAPAAAAMAAGAANVGGARAVAATAAEEGGGEEEEEPSEDGEEEEGSQVNVITEKFI